MTYDDAALSIRQFVDLFQKQFDIAPLRFAENARAAQTSPTAGSGLDNVFDGLSIE